MSSLLTPSVRKHCDSLRVFFFFLYRCCINQRLFPPSCKYDELNRSPAPTGRVGRATTSDATGGVISLLWLSTDDREPRFTPGARWGRIERRRLQRVRFSEPTWDDRRGLWGEGGGVNLAKLLLGGRQAASGLIWTNHFCSCSWICGKSDSPTVKRLEEFCNLVLR